MKDLFGLIVGTEIGFALDKHEIFERATQAETKTELLLVVNESLIYAKEVIDQIFKQTPEAQAAKNEFLERFVAFHFDYFGLRTPFEDGVELADMKKNLNTEDPSDNFFQ